MCANDDHDEQMSSAGSEEEPLASGDATERKIHYLPLELIFIRMLLSLRCGGEIYARIFCFC